MADPQTEASLLGLPPELRNSIYELALTSEEPHILRNFFARSIEPGLLVTCKQVRQEARDMYWNNLKLCIANDLSYCDRKHLAFLGEARCRLVASVFIDMPALIGTPRLHGPLWTTKIADAAMLHRAETVKIPLICTDRANEFILVLYLKGFRLNRISVSTPTKLQIGDRLRIVAINFFSLAFKIAIETYNRGIGRTGLILHAGSVQLRR